MKNFQVLTLPVGQLNSNCYIYKISKSKAVIIDPGDDAEHIIQKLMDQELEASAILATHGHFDHIMAGFTLQAAYNCPFYINKKDEFLVSRMRETAIHFGEVDPGPPPITTFFKKDSNFKIDDLNLKILTTDGHTPGSVSYFDEDRGVVFVGDLMFSDGSIGEVSHKYSDRANIKKSILKILSLPEDTIVYPGHGETSDINELRQNFGWALGK